MSTRKMGGARGAPRSDRPVSHDMRSASHRKLSPERSPRAAEAGTPPEGAPPPQARLAARLRDLDRRLAQVDESLGADEGAPALFELDGVRARMAETAAACDGLAAPGEALPRLEEAVKRVAWAVQSLEACRGLDDAFSARLGEVRARLEDVSALLGIPDAGA